MESRRDAGGRCEGTDLVRLTLRMGTADLPSHFKRGSWWAIHGTIYEVRWAKVEGESVRLTLKPQGQVPW